MSFSSANLPGTDTLRRQNTALVGQAREDMFLKLVALLTAIILYVYVQAEHSPSPQVTVTLQAELTCIHIPDGVKWDAQVFPVKVTGPRILVESLKDGDIRADVDLNGQDITTGKTAPMVPKYSFPALKPEAAEQIHIDGPNTVRAQLSVFISKPIAVHVPMHAPPAGMHYERAVVSPERVVCTGIEADVKNVSHVIANVEPTADGRIRGDFAVVAIDKEEREIKNLTLTPDHVHVVVPLVADPPMQFALVSPVVASLPVPPYRIELVSADPSRVKIVGRAGKLGPATTLSTEDIALHDATADTEIVTSLLAPPNVVVYDLLGHRLNRVHIRFHIVRGVVAPTESVLPVPSTGSPPPNGTQP